MALITSSMSPAAVQGLLTHTQVGSEGVVVSGFITGLHRALWLSFIVSIIAVLASLMRGSNQSTTQLDRNAETIN